jgi:ribonuclease D
MKCFPTLKSELEKQQRTQWLKSECQLYEDESFYQKPLPQNLYHRIKGAGRLNREQLAILRELAAWREDVAIKLDLRPKIFLSEPTLFSIVYNKPSNTKDLKNCRDMPPQVMHYNSRDILNCIDVGLSLDEDQKPALIEKRIPSKKEEKFADTLYQMALNKSQQLQMATNLLITKTQCKKIASWNFKELAFDFSNMIQWRQDILKDDILKISQKFS